MESVQIRNFPGPYFPVFVSEKTLYLNIFLEDTITVWKVSKYVVFSGPYFPVFGLNTGLYGQEKTPYLDTFHAAYHSQRQWYYW